MKHNSLLVIKPAITTSLAKVLLAQNIPSFISILDADELICKVDTSLNDLTPRFRKSQITQNITVVSYCKHSVSGRGRVSYRLDGNREVVKLRLEQLVDGDKA